MSRFRITLCVGCITLLIALLSPGGGGLLAADPTKVRVGYINNVQSAALVQLKVLSKESNLEIELVPFTRYPDVQKALAVDSIDVGVIAPNGLPAAVAQGDRNVIAVMDLVYGGNSMVVRKGVEINEFADLKGKQIGLAEGGISWMMFMMLLEQHKIAYTDIQALNFSAATDAVNALKHGDMDVVDLWEPFVSQAVAAGYGRDHASSGLPADCTRSNERIAGSQPNICSCTRGGACRNAQANLACGEAAGARSTALDQHCSGLQ